MIAIAVVERRLADAFAGDSSCSVAAAVAVAVAVAVTLSALGVDLCAAKCGGQPGESRESQQSKGMAEHG